MSESFSPRCFDGAGPARSRSLVIVRIRKAPFACVLIKHCSLEPNHSSPVQSPQLNFHLDQDTRRRCHENASDCLRLDRCGGDAGDTGTCLLLTRLPSRRTMSRVQRSVPAILRSGALLWSTATLRSGAVLRFVATIWSALLRLRLGQPIWRSSTAGNSSWAHDDVGRAAGGRVARSDALAALEADTDRL